MPEEALCPKMRQGALHTTREGKQRMQHKDAEQKLVLQLLTELLSQRCSVTPQIHLQRYEFALRSLIYNSPRQGGVYQTARAYQVLVEAMHLIYHKKESDAAPWVHLVEETTYDAFRRLEKL